MEKRAFKDHIYGQLAEIVKAMANPNRLEILELLAQGPYSVEDVAGQTELSVANASQHLQVMKRARLVTTRRQGNRVFYRLADHSVYKAWKALRDLGIERDAEIKQTLEEFRSSRHSVEPLNQRELMDKMDNKKVTVIDVRPQREFEKGHIAGALNVPVDQLEDRLDELPSDHEVVAYCRGPFCVFADDAVQLLNQKGYSARRLDGGFPDWNIEDRPSEVESDAD